MPEGPIVCNAGPLIALAMVGQLEILRELYDRVVVPEAVFREVVEAGTGRVGAREVKAATWLQRVEGGARIEPLLAAELGSGEAAVIEVAARLGARLVLLDERRARRIAEHAYGLRVMGTARVLVAAKRAGVVSAVRPLLAAMVAHGYFISDRVVERACDEAGE